VVVVNPNNPTGSFLKRREWDFLSALCAARSIAILSDEVFADYAFAPDERRVSTLAGSSDALAFAMSGLSKIAGLPQMTLGWIVSAGPPALRDEAEEKLELIADTYLSVASPVQHAAPRLLDLGAAVQRQIAARVRTNFDWLRQAIGSDSCVRLLPVEGGWYAILQVPRIRTEEEWTLALLEEDHVLVQPGFFYDFEAEAFLVVSLLTPPEIFQSAVRRLLLRAGTAPL